MGLKTKLIGRKMSQPPSLAMPYDPSLGINSSNISLQVPNLTVRNQFKETKLIKVEKFKPNFAQTVRKGLEHGQTEINLHPRIADPAVTFHTEEESADHLYQYQQNAEGEVYAPVQQKEQALDKAIDRTRQVRLPNL